MKTLGLCSVVLLLVSMTFAQQQLANNAALPLAQAASTSSPVNSVDDDAIVQLWNAHAADSDRGYLEGDKLIVSSESDTNDCLLLRVYQMKRESRHSDVTVPAGYTTCVPARKTGIHNAVDTGNTTGSLQR